ncbi:MAG TPA: N(4)-(beta-N-acetylglucosaminyl)-L-asparaginase [Terriglobia bacterium]|jgi:L-asparaginase/N4-(beta-N-acetylglucosaminyl)-L-asparaginase|nr:N(4)-(beta-N-acetylglucosaminyl)-L-asparaginase [Terriglobia bacterium]
MDSVNRRDFMKSIAAAGALANVPAQAAESESQGPVFLATWPHGKPAVDRAAEVFHQGRSLLDAVEKGINVTEEDPKVTTVGYGGLPNAEGTVELDAGIMDGTRHRAGAVCGLRGVKTPISVARLVLEKTTHTTMGGIGLQEFAQKMGFQFEQLLTPESLRQWMQWKADPHHKTYWISADNHDTIGMVATDGKGHIAAGCSTSGLAWKIPGRIADSPLVGCGFYADDNAGGASATGDGDLMTNYCTSVTIVHMMARGASPQEACEELLRNMVKTDPKNKESECAVIAMNTRGEIGAASMNSKMHLQYALWKNGESRLLDSRDVF